MEFYLKMKKADGASEKVKLRENETVYIGRVSSFNDEDNTIVDDHQTVSRRHAKITIEGDAVVLVDCNSSNSTFLNGKAINPSQQYPLKEGDEVRLAESTTVIRVKKSKSEGERPERSRSRSRDEPKTQVSQSTKKMLKALDKYKTRQEKVKFLKLMGHKNAQAELDSLEKQLQGKGKINFERANEQIEKQFEQGRKFGGVKRGLGS